jgi:hypothetical protein
LYESRSALSVHIILDCACIKICLQKKLSDVKPVTGAAIKGSLLHYVDNLIYSGCGSTVVSPKLLADMAAAHAGHASARPGVHTKEDENSVLKSFCDGWLNVYSCSKISIKQILDAGLTELQQMIKVCKSELAATANTQPEYKLPLAQRIDHFLDHADLRVLDVEKQAKNVEAMIKKLRCVFAEGETASGGDCISMSFFGPFGDFAANFSRVHTENNRLRIAVSPRISFFAIVEVLILVCMVF